MTQKSHKYPCAMKKDNHKNLWAFFLVPILPVIHLAANNPGQASWQSIAEALLSMMFVTALLMAILFVLTKSPVKSGLVATSFIVVSFLYGPVHDYIDLNFIDQKGLILEAEKKASALRIVGSIFLVLFLFFMLSSERLVHGISRFIKIMSLFLATSICLQWIINESDHPFTRTAIQKPLISKQKTIESTPDIYFIVLDGYARNDILRQYYNYDNSSFTNTLQTLGFTVNPNSRANYSQTFLSLGSMLNYSYWPDLINIPDPESNDVGPFYDQVRDNAAAKFLKQNGYRFIHFESTWGATQINPYADETIQCHDGIFQNEFHRTLAEMTWLRILRSSANADLASCHLSNLKILADMGKRTGPKFVFAHFIPPHHPYLFDKNGNVLRNAVLSDQFEYQKKLWEEKTAYLEQLEYMSKRMTSVIENIIRNSEQAPVIILASDHGPNIAQGLSREEHIQVRLANFMSYLTPGYSNVIPTTSSSVNIFRYIFNHYFKADLPILPEKSYFSPFRYPFRFEEISHNHSNKPLTTQ